MSLCQLYRAPRNRLTELNIKNSDLKGTAFWVNTLGNHSSGGGRKEGRSGWRGAGGRDERGRKREREEKDVRWEKGKREEKIYIVGKRFGTDEDVRNVSCNGE